MLFLLTFIEMKIQSNQTIKSDKSGMDNHFYRLYYSILLFKKVITDNYL